MTDPITELEYTIHSDEAAGIHLNSLTHQVWAVEVYDNAWVIHIRPIDDEFQPLGDAVRLELKRQG